MSKLPREGVQSGYVQYARSKRIPRSAILSIAGVWSHSLPAQLKAAAVCWSEINQRMFRDLLSTFCPSPLVIQ